MTNSSDSLTIPVKLMMFNIFELAKVLTNRNFRKIRIYYYFSKIGREVCGNE